MGATTSNMLNETDAPMKGKKFKDKTKKKSKKDKNKNRQDDVEEASIAGPAADPSVEDGAVVPRSDPEKAGKKTKGSSDEPSGGSSSSDKKKKSK